ncbi:hypothetical protein TIFTF001_020038 [Ficus carica]|uniref:Uncharacterized protein n=1 Tax=Ficus carica TaxID=3494 RepID=A0AA88DAN0_FICCA|nr:hypothetical protein TIFTF001_020038 [Ficus carica]
MGRRFLAELGKGEDSIGRGARRWRRRKGATPIWVPIGGWGLPTNDGRKGGQTEKDRGGGDGGG